MAQTNDFKIWLSAEASKEVYKNLEVNGRIQSRLGQNASFSEKIFAEAGADYKITDFYSTGLKYRIADFNLVTAHRVDFDNTFKYERFNDKFDLRIRLQHRFQTENQFSKDRLRLRFGYTHKFSKKLRVYAKAEYFYTQYYKANHWDQQRYTVGSLVRVYKVHFVDFFYRYQNQYNVENPESDYILGVSYVLKL